MPKKTINRQAISNKLIASAKFREDYVAAEQELREACGMRPELISEDWRNLDNLIKGFVDGAEPISEKAIDRLFKLACEAQDRAFRLPDAKASEPQKKRRFPWL